MANDKVQCIVLDASPLLLNEPSISSLLAAAEELHTTPAVLAEIRDPAASRRLETTVLPFLKVRTPSPVSLQTVSEFARKTGDYAVLSGADIQVLALAYELECERNHGDWRLRKIPGQKGLNGMAPALKSGSKEPSATIDQAEELESSREEAASSHDQANERQTKVATSLSGSPEHDNLVAAPPSGTDSIVEDTAALTVSEDLVDTSATAGISTEVAEPIPVEEIAEVDPSSDSDSDGWITPSNLRRHQQRDNGMAGNASKTPSKMQVATLTSDYALQNTLILMNLNLLSSSLSRISHLKSHILRCHACFATCKQMDRHFCPRCGQPTLTRVTCTTAANGEFKLHLKRNMQWNHRGDRYSIPKPSQGSSGRKAKATRGQGQGGKGGWGKELILSEDQKEYTRALASQKRRQTRDLMDEDYLPDILSGARSSTAKIKVGAGRDVNARKR